MVFLRHRPAPIQHRHIETTLFPSFPFARSVLHGTTLRLGDGDVVRLLVHAEVGLHAGLLVKHFPDRGRFVAAMFLVGQSLKGPVEGTRKSDRDCRRFLVPHATEGGRTRRKRQEFSPLAMVFHGLRGVLAAVLFCRFYHPVLGRFLRMDPTGDLLAAGKHEQTPPAPHC